MPAFTQASRLLAWTVLGLLLLGACGRKRPSRHKPEPLSSALPGGAALEGARQPSPAPNLPPGVASALREVRERRLALTPAPLPVPGLAFSRNRLLVLGEDRARLFQVPDGKPLADLEVPGAHAVAATASDAFVVLTETVSWLIEPGSKAAKKLPHLAFLPGSACFTDLERPLQLFVFYAEGGTLFRYGLSPTPSGFLPIVEQDLLPGYAAALGMQRDGAFVYASSDALHRYAPHGTQGQFAFAPHTPRPFRLLPAERLDEVYAVAPDGEVARLRLDAGLPKLLDFRLAARPFEAAGTGQALAFILVEDAAGGARRWTLAVDDAAGTERLRADLPGEPPDTSDDWAAALARNKKLALSAFLPLVAVGGPDTVSVWDYEHARELFTR